MNFSFENLVAGSGDDSQVCVAEVGGVQLDTVASTVDATSLAEAVDIQSEVQNLVVEFDNGVARIEAVEDAAVAAETAEEAGAKLMEAAEAGEEPTVATVEAINLLLARAMKGTGRQQAMQMSTESFGVGRNRKAALKASAEGIVDTAKDLYKSAIEFIKKLIARVAEWFQSTMGTAARLEGAYKKLYAKILAKKDSKISSDMELSARRFAAIIHSGKAEKVTSVKLSEVLKSIEANIKASNEVKSGTQKVVDDLTKVVESAMGGDVSLADAGFEKFAFGFNVTVKIEGGQILANTAEQADKDLIASDATISADGQTVGDLAAAAKAGLALAGNLRKEAVLGGDRKKVLDASIKRLEEASKKAASGATPAEINLAKRDARNKVKYLAALVKTSDGLYTKVAMAGAASTLAFLSAVSAKTEKAE